MKVFDTQTLATMELDRATPSDAPFPLLGAVDVDLVYDVADDDSVVPNVYSVYMFGLHPLGFGTVMMRCADFGFHGLKRTSTACISWGSQRTPMQLLYVWVWRLCRHVAGVVITR